jgi:hypothetical protein
LSVCLIFHLYWFTALWHAPIPGIEVTNITMGIQINKALVRSICINVGQNDFTYDFYR